MCALLLLIGPPQGIVVKTVYNEIYNGILNGFFCCCFFLIGFGLYTLTVAACQTITDFVLKVLYYWFEFLCKIQQIQLPRGIAYG